MDIELYEQIQHLDEYTNAIQLEILQKEIHFILYHEFQPPVEWYDERIDKIYTYSHLNWDELCHRFNNKDYVMHNTSAKIQELIDIVINQWSGHSHFNLQIYRDAIDYIYYIWKHYESTYIGNETDSDIIELTEDITHLHTA